MIIENLATLRYSPAKLKNIINGYARYVHGLVTLAAFDSNHKCIGIIKELLSRDEKNDTIRCLNFMDGSIMNLPGDTLVLAVQNLDMFSLHDEVFIIDRENKKIINYTLKIFHITVDCIMVSLPEIRKLGLPSLGSTSFPVDTLAFYASHGNYNYANGSNEEQMSSASHDTNANTSLIRPNYYGGENSVYECIKVIEAWNLNFSLGNAIKYISRAGKKDPLKKIEDLKEAKTYIEFEINRLDTDRSIMPD